MLGLPGQNEVANAPIVLEVSWTPYKHEKFLNVVNVTDKFMLQPAQSFGVFPKYRKAFLAEFAEFAEFAYFNLRYWPNQAFDILLYACIYADPAPLPVLRT